MAERLPGEPAARCAHCSFLLVELAVPVRIATATGHAVITHAHSAQDWGPCCEGGPPDGRVCPGPHDEEPCAAPEPEGCSTGGCPHPAAVGGGWCRFCDPSPDAAWPAPRLEALAARYGAAHPAG